MMNKEQRAYAEAKAAYKALEEMHNEAESAYIEEQGIINEDGKAPAHLWMMDDEESFDFHNEILGKMVVESGLEEKINAAREKLKEAEEALIEFGISIAPEGIRDNLRNGCKDKFNIRERMIEATFKLDAATVGKIGGNGYGKENNIREAQGNGAAQCNRVRP